MRVYKEIFDHTGIIERALEKINFVIKFIYDEVTGKKQTPGRINGIAVAIFLFASLLSLFF